jgi:hypothetical protein
MVKVPVAGSYNSAEASGMPDASHPPVISTFPFWRRVEVNAHLAVVMEPVDANPLALTAIVAVELVTDWP